MPRLAWSCEWPAPSCEWASPEADEEEAAAEEVPRRLWNWATGAVILVWDR